MLARVDLNPFLSLYATYVMKVPLTMVNAKNSMGIKKSNRKALSLMVPVMLVSSENKMGKHTKIVPRTA